MEIAKATTPTKIGARILLDSISAAGVRLTTVEATYHRFIHAELMTHRMFSRNSASSRAIPIQRMIDRVATDPAIPVEWGSNKAGMQAGAPIEDPQRSYAAWLDARDRAIASAQALHATGIHKQICNRVLEPFLWHTTIITATDYDGFYALRISPQAQPEIRELAIAIRNSLEVSQPTLVPAGYWHLPLILDEERGLPINQLLQISTARCARVSYLTHDGRRDHEKDIELYKRLETSGHWSPFEHVATPTEGTHYTANFRGWKQFRKFFTNEYTKIGADRPERLKETPTG